MALIFILEENLTETSVPHNIALSGVAQETAEPQFVDIFWRYDDEDDMKPQYLGVAQVGTSTSFAFAGLARPIRLFQFPLSDDGVEASRNFSGAEQISYDVGSTPATSGGSFVFSETVGTSGLVNIWSDGGVPKARKASALVVGKEAHGFAPAGVLATEEGDVFFVGNIIANLAGLTPGQSLYLSETGGEMTAVPPTLVQRIGSALDATTAIFEPHPMESLEYLYADDGTVLTDDEGNLLTE